MLTRNDEVKKRWKPLDEALDTKDKYGSSLEMIANKDQIHSYPPCSSLQIQTAGRSLPEIKLANKMAIKRAINSKIELEEGDNQ